MNNIFKITIGSSPKISSKPDSIEHINHDLQLIKAALLYSDKVDICSPTGNFFNRINTIREMSESTKLKDKINIIDDLSSYINLDPNYLFLIRKIKEILNKKHLSPQEIIFKQQILKGINNFWKEQYENNFGLSNCSEIKDIIKLYESGLIEYYNFKSPIKNIGEELLNQFTEYITNSISDPYSYPLLDDLSGLFISGKISTGEIKVDNIDIERSKHVSLAANIFKKLPYFDLASVDEILDIRNELKSYLINFRAGMISLSKLIKSSQWNKEFKKEVEILFMEKIEPSINEIDELIKTKTYFKSLISRISSKNYKLPASVFGITVAGQITNLELLSIIVSGITVGANLMDIYNSLRKEKLEVEQNQLFFYYKARHLLSK